MMDTTTTLLIEVLWTRYLSIRHLQVRILEVFLKVFCILLLNLFQLGDETLTAGIFRAAPSVNNVTSTNTGLIRVSTTEAQHFLVCDESNLNRKSILNWFHIYGKYHTFFPQLKRDSVLQLSGLGYKLLLPLLLHPKHLFVFYRLCYEDEFTRRIGYHHGRVFKGSRV